MADDAETVRLSSEPDAAAADIAAVGDRIDAWNMDVTGVRDFRQVAIFLRDDAGRIRGGVTGGVWGGWLHVVSLWVDQDLRGRGLGATSCSRPRTRRARLAHGPPSSRRTRSRRPASTGASATRSSRRSRTTRRANRSS